MVLQGGMDRREAELELKVSFWCSKFATAANSVD